MNETPSKLRSPIAWFGGKGMLRKKLLDLLPPHDKYVEPFGGGASILLAKKPVPIETYNDLDSGLYTFFSVLSNPLLFPHFWVRVRGLPYSREFYDECLRTWQGCRDELERACRWFVVARQSFAGEFSASWGSSISTSTVDTIDTSARWQSILVMPPQIHQRLQRVQIEHADFRSCLTRYQGPGYLAYCDPPYCHSTRKSGRYVHEMTDSDHQELVEILLRYNGAVVLSGYANELYVPLEKAGWDRTDFETCCMAAGRTRATKILGAGAAKARVPRVETVWRNPEALRRCLRSGA